MRHMTRIATFSALLIATSVAANALAQEGTFGARNQLVFSAERLAGVYWVDANSDVDGTTDVGPITANTRLDIESNGTKVAFLGNDGGVDFATVPRVGFDFFVVDNVSVGAAFIYISDSDESDTTGTGTAGGQTITLDRVRRDESRSGFVIAPRAGYGRAFSDHIGLWARGGLTYGSQTQEVEQTTTDENGQVTRVDTRTEISLFSLSLDVQLLLIPIDHFAFGIGPFVEIPLSGSIDFEENDDGSINQFDGDLSVTTFGLTATLIGWL